VRVGAEILDNVDIHVEYRQRRIGERRVLERRFGDERSHERL